MSETTDNTKKFTVFAYIPSGEGFSDCYEYFFDSEESAVNFARRHFNRGKWGCRITERVNETSAKILDLWDRSNGL
jgi:hypothetical protein